MLFGRKRKLWLQGQTWVMMKTWIFQSPAVRKWQCIHFAAQWAISSAFVKQYRIHPLMHSIQICWSIILQVYINFRSTVSNHQCMFLQTKFHRWIPCRFLYHLRLCHLLIGHVKSYTLRQLQISQNSCCERIFYLHVLQTLIVQKVLTRRVHHSATLCPNLVSPHLRKWICPWNGSDQTIQSLRVHCVLLTHRTQHWDASRIDCLEDTAGRKWWNILNVFPNLTNKNNAKLFDLVDMLNDVELTMANPQYTVLLSYFNSPCICKASG